MKRSEIVRCKKCEKEYKVEVTRCKCKAEDGRVWNTFYTCPYCGQTVEIMLSSDEDVRSCKIHN